EEAGVVWDGLGATAPGTRVLNDRDRRECVMRARHELMREAETAGEAVGKNRPGDVIGAAVEVTQVPNGQNTDNPALFPLAEQCRPPGAPCCIIVNRQS